MADTPESKIFRKLADALTFHPAGAKLFMPDWALEPGDIVTVSSDNEDYDVPLYSMNFTWNGQGMAEVQSTGNQKREPLSALRRKEYQSGRRGAGRIREIEEEFKEFETWKVETDETLENHAGQFVEILGEDGEPGRLTIAETNIGQTASDAYIIATAAGIKLDENGHPELDDQGHYQYDPDAGDTTLTARINTNASDILARVSQQDLTSTLSSYLLIDAFGTKLGTTLENGDTTLAANIITAVNKNTNTSEINISADQINLEGYVKASYVDAAVLLAESLTTETGYAGTIYSSSVNAGTVETSTIHITNPEGSSSAYSSYSPKSIYIGTQKQDMEFLGHQSNAASFTIPDGIKTIAVDENPPDGKIGFVYTTFTNDTQQKVNFNIADTAKYKADVGIKSTGEWVWKSEDDVYVRTIEANNNDTAEVGLPSITVSPVLGTGSSGTVNAYGPVVGQSTRYEVASAATLYLQVDDDHCYITTNQSTPASSGQNANIVAQIDNPGSGTAYSSGYTDGQDNAFASIKSIEIDEGSASYASSNLSVNITAVPQLSLIKQDETTAQSDGESENVAQTLPVAVTNVTISDSSIVYNNNRTYTIGGSGGNVNIGAVNGVGGANIPVDTSAHPFTPTEALNAVNVVKGNWTGTTTKTIEFTTDAPSPNASAPKSVTLSWNNGSWVWASSDDSGNYQKQIQVKDGSSGVLTDYVDLPDISVDYIGLNTTKQDSWWQESGTYANQYVIPAFSANAYLSSDTSKQHVLYSKNGGPIVIDPSEAIALGKSRVSVTRTWTEYDGTPSGDTTLDPGKTYHLEVKKDSTTVYDELYTVPAQAAPTVNTWGLAHQTGTDYTYKASVNVNGTQYESGNLNATEAYNNGWTGAYQSVGIFPTAVADLVPGGSPITIYAQAKANSGSAKSNVASVQVKARALNLKDETFTANDTYAVPEGYDGYGAITVNVQGGGGSSDRRAVFLDNITLNAPTNPEPGFNWQFTESSFAHYTDPVSVETDAAKKTQVTIDASAIYQAGLDAGGGGGVVDVIKGNWSTASTTQVATCEFTTNTGGTPQSVTINQVADSASSNMGRLAVRDGTENISTAYFYLTRIDDKVVLKYAPYSYTNNPIDLFLIARDASSGPTIASYTVGGSEAPVIEADVKRIVKNPTQNVTYSENYKTAYIPVQGLDEQGEAILSDTISASVEGAWNAGHTKGFEDGSGIKIEQEKAVTASQNNTTITVLPTYTASEQYDVMGSVKVKVQVPTYGGISSAEINDQSETAPAWWRKELGTGTLSSQYGQIKVTGVDNSTKYYVVDASQVWQNGFNEGAGAQFTPATVTLQGNGPISITPVNLNTGTTFNRYGYEKLYYYDDDREKYVECQSRARYWFYTTSDTSGGAYYQAGTPQQYYGKGQTITGTYYTRTA